MRRWLLLPALVAQFEQIVLYGARAKDGMAPFADMLNEKDVEAIHAYLIDRAIAAHDGANP